MVSYKCKVKKLPTANFKSEVLLHDSSNNQCNVPVDFKLFQETEGEIRRAFNVIGRLR